MKIFIVFSLWLLPAFCYSQNDTVIVYLHKGRGFKSILLLACKTGYLYSGPHLLTDEVFTFKYKEKAIIRTFDSEYSLRSRTDTLFIENKNRLRDKYGSQFKKVNSKTKTRLLEKYILPSSGTGNYRFFLQKLENYRQ